MNAESPGPPTEQADANIRKHLLARSVWLTVPGTYAAIALAYALTPAPSGLVSASERLIFGVRWLFVAFVPYAAVCLVILYERFAEGAHNPLLHRESRRLQIHCRVMQNTLEQLIWFALCALALATYLSPERMRLLPVLCVFFALAVSVRARHLELMRTAPEHRVHGGRDHDFREGSDDAARSLSARQRPDALPQPAPGGVVREARSRGLAVFSRRAATGAAATLRSGCSAAWAAA